MTTHKSVKGENTSVHVDNVQLTSTNGLWLNVRRAVDELSDELPSIVGRIPSSATSVGYTEVTELVRDIERFCKRARTLEKNAEIIAGRYQQDAIRRGTIHTELRDMTAKPEKPEVPFQWTHTAMDKPNYLIRITYKWREVYSEIIPGYPGMFGDFATIMAALNESMKDSASAAVIEQCETATVQKYTGYTNTLYLKFAHDGKEALVPVTRTSSVGFTKFAEQLDKLAHQLTLHGVQRKTKA